MAERVMDLASSLEFEYIGHRVVHGGELFRDVTEMTRENLSKLRQISSNDCKVATRHTYCRAPCFSPRPSAQSSTGRSYPDFHCEVATIHVTIIGKNQYFR